MKLLAPAKLNLCLYLGPGDADGFHRLASIFDPLELADEIEVSDSGSGADEVVCAGVDGPNLAEAALARLRRAGWSRAGVRLEIRKRIPVAAGLGGGSADAAAVLRLAGGDPAGLAEAALRIGADVPSQLRPDFQLVTGIGQVLEPLPRPAPHWFLVSPVRPGLETGEVFAEADRLGLARGREELDAIGTSLRRAARPGRSPLEYRELLVNDLEPAARSLHRGIDAAIGSMRAAGAPLAGMTGSGPTVFGLFADREAAAAAAAELPGPAILTRGGPAA